MRRDRKVLELLTLAPSTRKSHKEEASLVAMALELLGVPSEDSGKLARAAPSCATSVLAFAGSSARELNEPVYFLRSGQASARRDARRDAHCQLHCVHSQSVHLETARMRASQCSTSGRIGHLADKQEADRGGCSAQCVSEPFHSLPVVHWDYRCLPRAG